MNYKEAKEILEKTFNQEKFNEDNFTNFLHNLFAKEIALEPKNISINEPYSQIISSAKIIGNFVDKNSKNISLIIVNLASGKEISRSRTFQRDFIVKVLQATYQDYALVAFVAGDQENWRFSLVKLEYAVNENYDVKKKVSSAKRYSFLLGKNEGSHTVKSRFQPILESKKTTIAEIEQAFNIETITDEFFKRYKELFLTLKEQIEQILANNKALAQYFDNKQIFAINFAKKTLGQIVFLYFLQKKGWFGVKNGKPWGSGDKNFLRNYFDKNKENKNFFKQCLEPLFYEALAVNRDDKMQVYEKIDNLRFPFLNGGLFEPINGYDWQQDLHLPNNLFSNTQKTTEGDIGDGILDIFDRYNFTVNENEPLEQEVAVDPEMLGKVFENLLEIKDRKSKGAFYTPREIVHYMCQETLINYLHNHSDLPIEQLTNFIKNKSLESVENSALKIDSLLENVKVCDPAVGSGAFMLGMLNEIVNARLQINKILSKNCDEYDLKFHTIANSIYGVDLDSGAVEIAKLRLWLALVVEEEEPSPLPNLDHKIMQGNSLLEEYEGIKLFDNQKVVEIADLFDGSAKKISDKRIELQDKIKNYFSQNDKAKKTQLKGEINQLKYRLIEATLTSQNKEDKILEIQKLQQANSQPFFLWKLEFSDVFSGENAGFDIVIGNPPYIQLQKDGGKLAKIYEKSKFESFAKSGDIYCLFYEFGLSLLKPNAHLAFITSNKWMRAGYGEKLRSFLSQKTNPKILIDLGPGVFETATVDTNILLYQKNLLQKNNAQNLDNSSVAVNCFASTIKENLTKTNQKLEDYLAKNHLYLQNFSGESWIISNQIEAKIKAKIEKIGVKLKDWDVKINYGIKTGFNEAFIIDTKTKEELCFADPKSAEIIKPILRGRDISRYSAKWAGLWIIIAKYLSHQFLEKDYPAIFAHLQKFQNQLQKRGQCTNKGGYGQHHWLELDNNPTDEYLGQFEKEKIVWQRITQEPSFYLSPSGQFVLDSMAFLSSFSSELGKFILSILNSKLVKYWVSKNVHQYGTTGYRLSNQYVEQIPIPQIPTASQAPFITIVDEILAITNKPDYNPDFPPARQKELEAKIDEMVCDLYQLDEEERKVVLGS